MTQQVCPEGVALLDGKATYYVADNKDPNNYLDKMQDCDALIVRIASCDANVIEHSPNLKVIGRTGVGYDSVDVKKATEKGIPVVITPGANSRSVAEHTLALILALAKNLCEAQSEMLKGNWKIRDAGKVCDVENKTVGIIGFGNIGRIVGQMCNGIGMKVVAYDPVLSKEKIESAGAQYCPDVESLLKISDFVTIHVPLLDSTYHMIGEKELSMMKKTAYIINCSRGGIVDDEALVRALKAGVIAGAGFDVFSSSEPPAKDDVLLDCPNIIITPHSAAQSREAVIRMAQMCVNGCLAVCEGKKWPYVADKKVYDHPKWKDAEWAF